MIAVDTTPSFYTLQFNVKWCYGMQQASAEQTELYVTIVVIISLLFWLFLILFTLFQN